MAEWKIEALWDRPAKLLAQSSTHYLLLRITPGGVPECGSTDPLPIADDSQNEDAAQKSRAPSVAIAIDCSRSMAAQDHFAACAQAAVQLAEQLGSAVDLHCAIFSRCVVPVTASQLAPALAQTTVRGVSRYDQALGWLSDTLASATGGPRVAVLLSDGEATDGMGYAVDTVPLVAQAADMQQAGAQLYCAGVVTGSGLLAQLAAAGGGAVLHPAALCAGLLRVLGLDQLTSGQSGATAAAPAAGPGLRLQLDSRQHGLQLRRACRLRPAPACLSLRSGINSWQLEAGPLDPWQTLEVLIEAQLPAAAFGTGEGPDPIVAAALLDKEGARLAESIAGLDYTSDPRRAQQLGRETLQARRMWELAGLDSWTALDDAKRGRRQTGPLPLSGPPAAPPVGGVP